MACPLSAASSASKPGVRKIAGHSPALRCGCAATATLSRQDSREKSRMFWNVRVMPPHAMRLALSPEISRPSKRTRPFVGA